MIAIHRLIYYKLQWFEQASTLYNYHIYRAFAQIVWSNSNLLFSIGYAIKLGYIDKESLYVQLDINDKQ